MERHFKKIDKNNNGSGLQNNLSHVSNSNINITSEEIHSSDEDLTGSAKKLQKRKVPSVYCKSWEADKILKPWITQNDKNHAFCKFCKCELKATGGVGDLYAHAERKKHIQAANALNTTSISKAFENMHQVSNHNKQVAMAEIQLSAFSAEHNIAFLTMEHMIPMLRSAIPDSKILQDLKCSRTKATCIVKNVIGATQLDELIDLMKVQPFSICIDESTDIGMTKLLSIVARTQYAEKIRDFFFALIKIQNCDAQSIFKKIVDLFLARRINYKKQLIGFAADGANVMTGSNHSVATLFKKECPDLIIFKCVCHSFALCANQACAELPKFVEGTARGIYNFIQNSPKRVDLFTDLQMLLDYKPKKMLHPAQTRWLSLEATVNQILSRLDVLKLFFIHEDLEKYEHTEKLIENLLNPLFELYLKFLKFVLSDINKLNRLFQSEAPQVHHLHSEVKRLYVKILDYFIKEEYVEEVASKKINFSNENVLKNIKDIYFGADVATFIQNLNVTQENEFRTTGQKFYIELCKQLLKRFDFDDKLLIAIDSIAPASVINRVNNTISNLLVMFPNVVPLTEYQEIDDEWREIRRLDFKKLLINEHESVEQFWTKIFLTTRGGTRAFPKLQNVIMALLTIPVSTANVERIFSQVNLNKTKLRNKLDQTTLSGILLSKDYMSKRSNNCVTFEQKTEMLKKLNATIYEKN